MAGINPVPRSMSRMGTMVGRELAKSEKLAAALPVWIGGTYVAFLGSIVAGVALGAGVASTLGRNSLVVVALGAAVGALIGRLVAKRLSADQPIQPRGLQVFLGITNRRVLIYEPKGFGKPGRLLAAFPKSKVSNLRFEKGGLLRPGRLYFGLAGTEHRYEFSGLWNIDTVLEAFT